MKDTTTTKIYSSEHALPLRAALAVYRVAVLHAEKGRCFGVMAIFVARRVRRGAGGGGDRGGDGIAALGDGMAVMLHRGGGKGDQGGGTCKQKQGTHMGHLSAEGFVSLRRPGGRTPVCEDRKSVV